MRLIRANSLALRLILSAAVWIVVILVITGVVLSSLYRRGVDRAFDRRLGIYLSVLVADLAAPEETGEKFPSSLGEPLFELPLSGWYWQVTRLDTPTPDVRSSPSLPDATLPHLDDLGVKPDVTGAREGDADGPNGQHLRILERTIDLADGAKYLVSVAGDAAELDDDKQIFDEALAITFSILAVVLLLTTMFQVRFGLSPLKRLSESLALIRSGRAERLGGQFPDEIAPLARETNALIDANREIVERARTHVGNLAHALKTPLSVIVNEATGRQDPLASKVIEQTGIMRDQVMRHLERARIAARQAVVGSITDVAPVVRSLGRTMEKIHHERAISVHVQVDDGIRFAGERQDLEEMVGNLVDNACKWASSRVAVSVSGDRLAYGAPRLRIVVDDDGRGLSPAEREQAAKRGERLDENTPGSGLGLSIVTELAKLYRGSLTLGAAPSGGLRAELVLPAAV
jgi:signal transduction histidine kinase